MDFWNDSLNILKHLLLVFEGWGLGSSTRSECFLWSHNVAKFERP